MLPEPRYVVTELTGYLDDRSSHRQVAGAPGVSYHVIDRHIAHRLLATYRTEDHGRLDGRFCSNGTRIAHCRMLAERLAAKLNGTAPPVAPRPSGSRRFRPTCPECGLRQPHDADRCLTCDTYLYLRDG
jgi:hypothetical protein